MAWRDESEARDRLFEAVAADGAAGADGATPAGALPAEPPPGFAPVLFGRTALEDLEALEPAALAELARGAFSLVSEAKPDATPRIRLRDLDLARRRAGPGRTGEVTVLEILNDNRPFLFDSTLAELTEQGFEPRLVAHPILAVERGALGAFRRFAGDGATAAPAGSRRESLIHVHLDRIDDAGARERLVEGLNRVYAEVATAVADWGPMRARLAEVMFSWRSNPPPLPPEEVKEALSFLEWLTEDNFTFLGVREYAITDRLGEGGGEEADRLGAPSAVAGTALGILRDPEVKVLRRGRELVTTSPEIRAFLLRPVALIVTKANVKSRVHRRVHMDYVGVKLFSPDGRAVGELRVVGLFTSSAYTSSTSDIPFIRRKVSRVFERAGLDPASHSGRALLNVLEGYPRDELFQIDGDTLGEFAGEILSLADRPRLRVLPRIDPFDRFVSVLVFIPKDRYDTSVRRRVGEHLARVYEGRVSAAYPSYPDGPLARTHYIIGRDEGDTPAIPRARLEEEVADLVRTWGDKLGSALVDTRGPERGRQLRARYAEAFNAAYREAFSVSQALEDVEVIEGLSEERPRAVELYRREGEPDTRAGLKLFSLGRVLALSDRVPLLENLRFRVVDERTYRVAPREAGGSAPKEARVWLHDMTLERAAPPAGEGAPPTSSGLPIDVAALGARVEAAILARMRGETETDGFDALVTEAGLDWREAGVMRALGRYLRQAGAPYAQDYLAATLAKHAGVSADLMALLKARFDPARGEGREAEADALRGRIEAAFAGVASLDEDRVLRRVLNLVDSALRTNLFQRDAAGRPREVVSFKFDSRRVEGLPAPRPLYEIFLTGPRVEGVHLRFGKVARGGLRWSDRPQDFRTEVLGLVKAQQVKNAVIVPVGAKGGFVPKRLPPPSDRAAWLAEGTESYKVFVRSLLELTDNLEGETVVPPPDTVRHDGDDPYLVVAADKGTATFSDTANALSEAKGHWLGDAFASGGSKGYDHKKMGITARGAWEAVKRHFREMDVDIQSTPFTVVGVGDMSGDVFGNGMLLSDKIRLLAAFDHRDIFLDPDPDPAISFAERKRLFELPRSSWADYDAALVSPGGGVFSRALKAIPLSPAVRAMLDLEADAATPAEVMSAILRARADLLWFGGIGTYVRASGETDASVGDRANDAIRVAGREVRARVIGEGANLGATQAGRIEAAREGAGGAGVRLNTDAIDNSAGVNTSDVEVNIKIALATPVRDGRLNGEARDALLAGMTDEVARLVLRNNYLQTLALSLAQRRGAADVGPALRLMAALEADGKLERSVEGLPNDAALRAREAAGAGLTRPEIAVLLAYAKLDFKDEILEAGVADDPYLATELNRYFPDAVRERFPDAVAGHRLRREIVATQLANAVVNRGGPTITARLEDETGASPATIARAYALARDAFGLIELNGRIDALDTRVASHVQMALYGRVQDLLLAAIAWAARNADVDRRPLEENVARFRAGAEAVREALALALPPEMARARAAREADLVAAEVPADLAAAIAELDAAASAPDIVLVAERTGRPVADAALVHFALADRLRVAELSAAARGVPAADGFDRLAVERALAVLAAAHRHLAGEILLAAPDGANAEAGRALDAWLGRHAAAVERLRENVGSVLASGLTVSKLTVAAGWFDELAVD